MIRKTIKGGDFKSQMVGELVFDQVPEEGSFNPVTSDGVAKAIDKAKDDMQDKIDEVTLDPSAVALGNVHLLDEVTEFPADGCILVDSDTNGPGEMPKDTLLTLTAQNALGSIHSLGGSADDFASDDYLTLDGATNGPRKMAKDVVLSKTAKKPLEELAKEVHYLDVSKQSFSAANSGYSLFYFVLTKGCKYRITNNSESGACNVFVWDIDSGSSVEQIVSNLSYGDSVDVIPNNDGAYIRVYFNVNNGSIEIENLDGASKVSQDLKNLVDARKIDKFPYVAAVENTNWESGYYALNVGIGNVVGAKESDGSFICQKIACVKGDCFVITGQGGSTPRLWGFVDTSNKLVSVATAETTSQNLLIEAPVDGYVIVNAIRSYDHFFYENNPQGKLQESVLFKKQVSENGKNISYVGATEAGTWQGDKYIVLNVGIGNVVSLVPESDGSYRYKVIDVMAGDYVFVRGQGGSAPRLWGFVDTSNKLVSVSAVGLKAESYLALVAPVDGKLIVNDLNRSYASVKSFNASRALKENQEVIERLDAIENRVSPLVEFEKDLTLRDVSSEVSQIDYSTTALQKTSMEQIYALYDSLVTAYPDYVSREDAASVIGLSYPGYANGVETEGTYLVTPAYKTYAYKFVCSSPSAGNNLKNKKKKLLIFSGVHGNEIAAPFNTYLFAKALCEAIDSNYFALRAAYDVYIVPCLNGYGMYHLTRVNANGVNINRNMPIERWVEKGAGTENYTGPSAGSEFESQIVIGYTNLVKPDILVDHHNYGDEMVHGGYATQYYIDIHTDEQMKLAYQQLVELSYAYIKGLPQYFGTSYKLLIDDSTTISSAPARLATKDSGTVDRWAYEQGHISATIEICNEILYYNGSPSASNAKYSADCFKAGEFMLRNFIWKLAAYAFSYAKKN